MHLFSKENRPYWVIGISFLLVFSYWFYLQVLPQKDTLLNYFFNVLVALFYFFSGVSVLSMCKTTKIGTLKNFFRALGLSLISWSVGNFCWSYYNIVVQADMPYPSVADIFYLLFPVFIGWGFWHLFDLFKFRPSRNNMRISLIIVSIAYFAVFIILSKPAFEDDVSVVATMLNFIYPLTDAFLIALGIITITAVNKASRGIIFITAGLLSQACGDLIFTYQQANNLYWNGNIADLFYLLSAAFIITGIYRIYAELVNPASR